jgi:hypothetical protein
MFSFARKSPDYEVVRKVETTQSTSIDTAYSGHDGLVVVSLGQNPGINTEVRRSRKIVEVRQLDKLSSLEISCG